MHRAACASFKAGCAVVWQWTIDGDVHASIRLDARSLPNGDGELRLRFRSEGQDFDQRFALVGQPCRFGGVRWHVLCPATGRLASKLYSTGGAGFHSRWRYGGLAYRCQRETQPWAVALQRRDRILCGKLKANDPCFVRKPKWMRTKTYSRLMAQLEQAEAHCDRHLAAMLARCGH